MEDEGPVELPLGKVVGQRWKIIEKLGEGGCGAVYKVIDRETQSEAESNFTAGGSVLKMEVQILNRLSGRKFVTQLLQSGKKDRYCYMVMTLLGPSLAKLFHRCRSRFSVSTQIRLAVQILYGLKQLHEIGYVHRDIKPANLSIGRKGAEARVVHLLDFGLAREYVKRTEGKVEMRRPRPRTLFRGTTKYCSAQSHTRTEQGRPDDLWSMMYVVAEFRTPLPWRNMDNADAVFNAKKEATDEQLFRDSPPKFLEATAYLRTLTYYFRPDYHLLYRIFTKIMEENKVHYEDSYDWEKRTEAKDPPNALVSNIRRRITKIMTISEDTSVDKSEDQTTVGNKTMRTSNEKATSPFNSEDFEVNEIGF